MNRAFLLSMSAVITACCFVGCGEKTPPAETNEEVQETAPAEPAETFVIDPKGNKVYEIPTETTRAIEATDDYEYEIKDGKAIITKYTGSDQYVAVPATIEDAPVTEIGYYAFEAKYDVVSVTLPESLEIIGEFAFSDCGSLESIDIPDSVTGIERGAFAACTSLTGAVIPESTGYIHEEAFTACESLTDLKILNPDLAYENWGLEQLPNLTVYAPEGSAVLSWAQEKGINTASL